MTLDPPSAAFNFLTRVALSYATLLDTPLAHPETGLGGKLFYAAELDEEGRALLVASNIAGAATLAASADRDAQKQALRDGVADFVVTNLDEALRILKNQLRKRETVAICVAQSPSEVEREMNQRGVAPDLLRSELAIPPSHDALTHQEKTNTPIAQQSALTEPDPATTPTLVSWRVDSALPKDLALLDEIALACLDPRLEPSLAFPPLAAPRSPLSRPPGAETSSARTPIANLPLASSKSGPTRQERRNRLHR